jgi:hypothetical protein
MHAGIRRPLCASAHAGSRRRGCTARAVQSYTRYGNLESLPIRRLRHPEAWQTFVLYELLDVYYDESGKPQSGEHTDGASAEHYERTMQALQALEIMSDEGAHSIHPDLLRMMLGMCSEAMPDQAMPVLEALCDALQPHPDLLVTLQYHTGARDAITRLLTLAAEGNMGNAKNFVRWLRVQRVLNVHVPEREHGLGLARYQPTVEGVYVGESLDSDGDYVTDVEELLAA